VTAAVGEDRVATQKQAAEQLQSRLGALQGQFEEQRAELEAARQRLQKAVGKDGQTWTEKVRANAPEFKPLDPEGRRTPILSVLNLKGGVGKTTVTANLGAALAARGYRVLLLDLDLQGSLTGLFLPEGEQARLHQEGRLLADFLDRAFDAEFPNLLDYTQGVLGGKSGLVATTDGLAYAEVNLTIRWLLRDSTRDPRFLLRRELHLKRVTNTYDVVLLDCPPLINVSCVNALAASDYVLIPVLPSKQATGRVPTLLNRLRDFRENINAELKVLGVLANRTYKGDELTAEEANRMSLLRAQCKDVWGQEVPALDTFIRQNTDVRRAEDDNRPLAPDDDAFSVFASLAREVEGRWPLFCRPAAMSGKSAKEVEA
jgi:cellulose biosynthesis protein BcsQ